MSAAAAGDADAGNVLVVYGRPRCHLCEVADEVLSPLARRLGVVVEHRNVEDDPEWERRYGQLVPAGVVRGELVFKYRVDALRLERALRARGLC